MNYMHLKSFLKFRQSSLCHRSITLTKTQSLNFSLLPVGSDLTSDPDNISNLQFGFLAHHFLEFLHLFKHSETAGCSWTTCKGRGKGDQA